jgi:site-specific DNA recombinase
MAQLRPAASPGIVTILLLRLSKDDAESESIGVQRANALAFHRAKGWEGEPLEIVAKGESGAEIRGRSDLQKLLRLAEERQGRIRVVMRNQDRLARDAKWTAWLLCELEARGVPEGSIWTYDTGRTIATRGTEYALTALEGVRSEGEWESNSKRRREALRYRALDGRPTRAAPWGYCTVKKRWVIDEAIRPSCILVASTFVDTNGSFRETARRLNARGIAAPGKLQKDGTRTQTRGWTARSVAAILRSELYRGVLVHGATRTLRSGGYVTSVAAPEEEVLRVPRPELRMWPDEIARTLDELLSRVEPGTHRHGREAAHLGSSFLKCGLCGGAISVFGRRDYACACQVMSKKTACIGIGFKSEHLVDAALLSAVAPLVGNGEIARRALAKLKERVEAKTRLERRDGERVRVEKALADAERRVRNGTAAVLDAETTDERRALQAAVRDQQSLAERLRGELASLAPDAPASLEARRLVERAAARLGELAKLHASGGVSARPVLLALLGKSRFTVVPVLVEGKKKWSLTAEIGGGYLAALADAPGSVRSAEAYGTDQGVVRLEAVA